MKTFTNLIKRASLSTFNKKRYYLFIIMLLALGVGNAWAEDVTFSWAGSATADGGKTDYVVEQTPVTLTFAAGTAQNAPRTNKEGSVRMYANTTLTISCASGNITKVTFTPTGTSYDATKLKYNGTALTSDEWTLSSPSNEVTLTASANARFKTIVVTYTSAGSGDEPSTPPTTYTIKWHTAVGKTTDVTLNEGAAITKPATDPTMTGYEFMGWTDQCNIATDGDGFTPLTNFGTADSDKDFYAVFAVEETTGGGGSTTGSNTLVSSSSSTYYQSGYITGVSGTNSASWTADAFTMVQNKNSSSSAVALNYAEIRVYASHSLVFTPSTGSTITSIVATATTDAYATALGGSSIGNCTKSVSGSVVTITPTDGTQAVTIANSAQSRLKTIVVNYTTSGGGTTTYNNYITTCASGIEYIELGDDFKWSAAEAEVTIDATDNVFPELTNTHNVPVKYSSSDDAIATIAADETVTLKKEGTVTITAKYEGGTSAGTGKEYKAKTVTYSLKVNKAPATPTGTVYVKTTNAVTDGEYLIVYEDAASTPSAPVIFDGSLETLDAAGNMKSVTISDNVINGDTEIDAATFTISAITDGFAIKSKSGKYIGRTSNGNGINTGNSEILNTITITDGVVKIAGSGSGASTSLQYYSVSGQERFRYYGTTQKSIALYKKASSHTLTYGTCTNGSVSADVADGATVLSGTTITLDNEPVAGNKLSAYDVYKTGDETTKVTVTDGKFVMPEFDVTISATFVPVKTLTSIVITTGATQTTFWQGETFNHTGLVVTAHFDGAENEVVTPTVTGSTATAGTQTVTVSYKEGEVTKDATYTITVKAIPNTKETAYSVADAYDIIDKLTTAEGVFISGIISQVDNYNDTYKSITYWISADGTTTNQLQAYSGKGLESADFTTVTDLTVGDQVIICGNLKKYSGTYEFDKNNYLASHTPTTKDPAGLKYATTEYTANVGEAFVTPVLTNPHGLTVNYSTSDASKATVDANTGAVTIVAAGKVTITASTMGDATHDAGSASYTITISNPAMAVATLPFAFNGKQADIANTPGMSHEGIDASDYGSAPYLKMNTTGDWLIIRFDSEPDKLSYDIKNNSFSGGTFSVQESADGETYTDVKKHTTIEGTQNEEHTLLSTSRYIKFVYTNKSTGNVGLGNIKITKYGEEPEQPGEGGGETALTEWVLTSAADITTNDLVVITMTKGETTWAMTNNNGTSAAPAASAVTLSANALAAEPAANLKWVVSNDNGTLTIYPYGGYETWLYCTNTNNGVRVGKGDAKEFTINANYLYTSLTTDPRHLGVYIDNNDWRCYKPSSGAVATNIAGQTLAFYVKKNANDILPGAGENPEGGEGGETPVVPTVNATATFIFNTAEGLNDLGIAYPATPTTVEDGTEDAFKTEFENNATFTQDGITMTTTVGTVVATRVWLTKNGALDLRVYKGATLTFSVPAEHKISAIVFDGSNIGHLLVNGNAVSNNAWTGSAQTITFTAKDDAKTIKINTIAFVVEYTRDVTNTYGTICLPYASASTSGAYFYEVVGKGTENGKPAVYLASVNTLEAGVPYIFEATASTIKVVYTGEAVDAPQNDDANGLVGTFTEITVPDGDYILYEDAFCTNEPAGTLNKIRANRAYLDMDAVTGGAPTQMPGRRYIGMSVQGENEVTGFDNIQLPNTNSQKLIINGQLIIIRDGEMYNAQGQRL